MNKKGWVVGLLGTVVVCALAASAARAAPEASRDARESGAGARPLVAAEEAPGLEGRVPAVAKEDLGGPAEATGGAKGGDPLREATGGQRGASVAAENAATVPDEPRRVREIPEQAAEELPEGSSVESISADESVLLNFERGDIREVIHSLATALGLSYMIDPRVEGQVTIRTIGRISKEHLFPVFNRILRNNGIAAVKVDSVYHIIPVGEAKTRAILPPTAATRAQLEATDSFIIEIIPVSHVAAEDMVGVLEPFVTPGGDVFAYPRGNLLIVTDLMTNVERLRDLAASLDTDAFKGMRTRVYKIEHGDLELITEELAALLSSYGHNVDGSTGLSLIPMPRLESLTCISYDQAAFRQIEQWLQVLDVEPEEGAGRIIQVYHVENTKAADLASILNELFGDGGGGGRSRARGRPFGQARSAFGRTGTSSRRGGRRGSAA